MRKTDSLIICKNIIIDNEFIFAALPKEAFEHVLKSWAKFFGVSGRHMLIMGYRMRKKLMIVKTNKN